MEIACEKLDGCPACGGGEIQVLDEPACLWKCLRCDLVFDNPRPDAPSIDAFYARQGQYDGWLSNLEARQVLWLRRWSLIRPFLPRTGAILDVGAGIGQFLSLAGEGWTTSGTELSPVARTIAKERWGIELLGGHLEGLGLPSESFDVVSMFHVLEHVPRPGETLAEIRRILKPGGVVVLAVPDEWGAATARISRVARLLGVTFAGRGQAGIRTIHTRQDLQELHLSRFRPDSLARLVEFGGFTLETVQPDPHQPPGGWDGMVMGASYQVSRALMRIRGSWNVHPAIMAIARRPV